MKKENSIKKMEEELVRNERLASEFIFFIDIGWIGHNANGTYRITTKCMNVTERMN